MLETENDDDATWDAYTFITTLGTELHGCQVPWFGYLQPNNLTTKMELFVHAICTVSANVMSYQIHRV